MLVISINRKTFIKICSIAAVGLVVVLILVASFRTDKVHSKTSCDKIGEYSLNARDEKEQAQFLEQFGYTAQIPAKRTAQITIPEDFNKVYEKYNDLQKTQGLDLSRFKGKNATQITYLLENEKISTDDNVKLQKYAVLIIYKNKVIGGHIETGVQNEQLRAFYKE